MHLWLFHDHLDLLWMRAKLQSELNNNMISVPSLDEELNHNGTDQSIAQTFITVGVDQSLVDLSIAPSLEDSNTINEVTD